MSQSAATSSFLFVPEEHPVRIEDGTPSRLRIHALEDVLEERVVGTPLWWCSEEVPSPWVALPRFALPLFHRVRRIGKDHVEGLESVALYEGRTVQRVTAHDVEV